MTPDDDANDALNDPALRAMGNELRAEILERVNTSRMAFHRRQYRRSLAAALRAVGWFAVGFIATQQYIAQRRKPESG